MHHIFLKAILQSQNCRKSASDWTATNNIPAYFVLVKSDRRQLLRELTNMNNDLSTAVSSQTVRRHLCECGYRMWKIRKTLTITSCES